MAQAGIALTIDIKRGSGTKASILAKLFPDALEFAVRQVADWSKKNIIKLTPIQYGGARSSWVSNHLAPFLYSVESSVGKGAKHTKYLEEGTGLWGKYGTRVVPKNGKYLIFPIIKGNTIVAWVKTTSTKGQKGNFMVARTQRDAKPKLAEAIKRQVIQKWGNLT